MKPTITLISDWRNRDPYLAIFKGQILDTLSDAHILDVTHYIDMFSISQTALLMKQSYPYFPESSIHLLLTNASFTSTFKPVVVKHNNHYFIGEDNGIFRLMFGNNAELSGWQSTADMNSTNSLRVMIDLIKAIQDDNLSATTTSYSNFKPSLAPEAYHSAFQRQIQGKVIYFDAFCNVVTNIPTAMFKEAVKDNPFTATIKSEAQWTIQQYHENHIPDKSMYLTNNALGLIEAAMYQGKLAILATISIGDEIIISY